MKLLVCGGRDYSDKAHLFSVLDGMHRRFIITEIIDGGASGADSLASEWAIINGIKNTRFAADWKKHGRAAGPIRNKEMIDTGRPEMVIAFSGGKGTANMIKQAESYGIICTTA